MKLRTKFAIVLLFITLILSSATYGGLELYKQQTLEQNQDSVDESARLAADQISASVQERKDYIGYVASRPETTDFSNSGRTIRGVVSNSRFFAAQIIAANGTVVDFGGQINATVRREALGSDVSDEAYFRGALNRSAHLSDPEYVDSRDRHLVVVSAPIFENGTVKGVFAASIYLTTDTIFSGLRPLNTASKRIVVNAGDEVVYQSSGQFTQTTTGQAAIDGTDWTITIARDRSRLNAQLLNLAFAQGIGLFIVLCSIVGLGIWEYRANLRQTERLLDAFSSLRSGDYDHSLRMTTGEEWVQISAGFNEMAESLSRREAAIREREQRLEVLNRVLRHNLRNDLNVILGYLDTIGDVASDEEIPRMASTARRRGAALLQLSRKARGLEKAMDEADGGIRAVDVAPTLRSTLADLESEHPDVDIRTSLPDHLWVRAIPSVSEALAYVCENACVHNDSPEPAVEVWTERVERGNREQVEIVVADNGPGIPSHERDVITAGRETVLEHGSGLGLWVANWIVRKVGGEIRFEDNEPTGAVVTLGFEAADADADTGTDTGA